MGSNFNLKGTQERPRRIHTGENIFLKGKKKKNTKVQGKASYQIYQYALENIYSGGDDLDVFLR